MMNVFRASTSQSLTPSCLLVLRPFVGRCQISTVKLTTSLIYTFSSRPANALSFTQVQVFLFCFISLLNNRSKQTTTYQPLDLGLLSTSYSNKAFNPYNNTMSQETHCFCHRQGNGGRKGKRAFSRSLCGSVGPGCTILGWASQLYRRGKKTGGAQENPPLPSFSFTSVERQLDQCTMWKYF